MLTSLNRPGGAVAQLGARLDGIEEVVGSNPIGSTKKYKTMSYRLCVGDTKYNQACSEFTLIH
jgi:hypothetical protein